MTGQANEVFTATVIDEVEVTIDEVTRYCAVRREKIIELVSEGIVEPVGQSPQDWRFDGRSLARAGKAIRLESGLEINLNAVAVILNLLDEIEELRRELERG